MFDGITKVTDSIGKAADGLFTSDEERLNAEANLEKIKQNPELMQFVLNKLQLAQRTLFIAGPRPFIMWVCGISIGLYFIPQIIMGTYVWVKLCLLQNQLLPFPIDGKNLFDLVLGLLGLGTLRTYEKLKGLTK